MHGAALDTANFRANPLYEVVPLDRLNSSEQHTARATADDLPTYGVIRAIFANGGSPQCVSADIALLFLTLREPGRMPEYFVEALGASWRVTLAGLVADGMLEIEIDGVYVSGPRGLAAMRGPALGERASRTDARSAAALRFALAQRSDDVREIAARLYAHHRIPASARWRSQLERPADVERFLGLDGSCPIEFRLIAGWQCWTSPLAADPGAYKLYVSPQPDALPQTVAAVVGAARYGARAMKIGGDMYGLLRPDKCVIYFATFESLADAAQRLDRALVGLPVHGVPFTATLGSSGLLSWGIDGLGPGLQTSLSMSWRQWVTLRIAGAIAVAKRETSIDADADAVWSFILQRLALDGVDARTWSPINVLHRRAGGSSRSSGKIR